MLTRGRASLTILGAAALLLGAVWAPGPAQTTVVASDPAELSAGAALVAAPEEPCNGPCRKEERQLSPAEGPATAPAVRKSVG